MPDVSRRDFLATSADSAMALGDGFVQIDAFLGNFRTIGIIDQLFLARGR